MSTIEKEKETISTDNWTGANLETLSQWIQISSLQIEVLDLAIKHYRSMVRKNVMLGLVFSTASGSISIMQMSAQNLFLNIIFTIMSFSIAMFTGLIKIYQVQERLEEFIQLKQEWIGFSVVITTEVQLPVSERKKALDLIAKNKNKYLDLLKHDVDIPNFIRVRAFKNLYHDKKYYLDNLEKYKRLKEILACTDEIYFIFLVKEMEKEERVLLTFDEPSCSSQSCCLNIGSVSTDVYKYLSNYKDKYIGEKTALSSFILQVIMEEEDEQRKADISALSNSIRDRKKIVEAKLKEYGISQETV